MDKDTGSLAHNEARSAQMREESKDNALKKNTVDAQRELLYAAQREQSIQAEEKRVTDLIPPGITRDQLLDRIRQMREEKTEVLHDYYISPEQQAQLELEQAEGRRQVAKAEAEQRRLADARALSTEVIGSDMTPVHHPNPAQDEQYPAIKSTLGKPAGAPKQLK